MEQFAPPSVLVNEAYDLVHVSENAGRYLHFSGGEPSRNLFRLIHPNLRLDLRAALYSAAQEGRQVSTRPIAVELGGEPRGVKVIVRPIKHSEFYPPFLLIIFDEAKEALDEGDAQGADADKQAGTPEDGMDQVVSRLEEELKQTRNILRATVEQSETSTEELRASNEELQAINEEMRSTTEELETSKEELQSLNEELQTVNFELKDKVEEVSRANADLSNLLASTDIGTIFLDRESQHHPLHAAPGRVFQHPQFRRRPPARAPDAQARLPRSLGGRGARAANT